MLGTMLGSREGAELRQSPGRAQGTDASGREGELCRGAGRGGSSAARSLRSGGSGRSTRTPAEVRVLLIPSAFLRTQTRSPSGHRTCKQPPSDICTPNYICISLIYMHSWRAIKTPEPASRFAAATPVNPRRGGRAPRAGVKARLRRRPRCLSVSTPGSGVRAGLPPVPAPPAPPSAATQKPAAALAVRSAPVRSDWRLSKKD